MQGSCRCQARQATTRHLAVKKTPRPLNYLLWSFSTGAGGMARKNLKFEAAKRYFNRWL
jgi:hypothetical protein